MVDSSAIGGINLGDIGLASPKKANEESDQNQFLQLFVAQLRNQNPLEPQEGSDFLAQLAQFSTVEGITNMEKAISSMTNSFSSNLAVQAASLVGKGVEVKTNQANFTPGKLMVGTIDVPQTVTNMTIEIQNSAGEVVKTLQTGLQEKGFVPFAWDGTNENGDIEPGGVYKVVARAQVNDELTQFDTYINSSVNSVTLNKDSQDFILNVDGFGEVGLADIRSIS